MGIRKLISRRATSKPRSSVEGMEIVVAVVVGIGSGLISSLLVWYLLTHQFLPSVNLSPKFARYTGIGGTPQCQLKYRNEGKRDAYNITVTVRLGIREITTPDTTEWMLITTKSLPVLAPGAERRFSLYVHEIERLLSLSQYLPGELRSLLDAGGTVSLSEIFDCGLDARVVAHVSASDSFSGAVRVHTVHLTDQDAVAGRFVNNSMTIDPTVTEAQLVERFSEDEQ